MYIHSKEGRAEKIRINFADELGVVAANIFKRAFVSTLKKYDKFHNGIVTAEKFCSSIKETDEYLRQENIWGVVVDSEDRCSVTSPIMTCIMSLVQITEDKYVNCKPLYLDVERIESTILVKNPYNESTVLVTQIQRSSLEKDNVKYSVRCPRMFLEDLYPPALESASKYSNKGRQKNIFEVDKMEFPEDAEKQEKLPCLRALPSGKLDDFRKLYAMWNKCMLSDEDFIMHMKKDIGIEKIPREFLLQVANKGPSRTLSFRDAICSLFINDVDSLRKYRPDFLVPSPSRIPFESIYNPITHENSNEKNSQRVVWTCCGKGGGYGQILSSINDDETLSQARPLGKRHRPCVNGFAVLNTSQNESNKLDGGSSNDCKYSHATTTESCLACSGKKRFDFLVNDVDSDEERAKIRGKQVLNYHRVTVTMPDTLQLQLKRCAAGETSGNAIRQYLKHYGIPISAPMDALLRRSDEDGSISFTSLMKEAYHSIKNMQSSL